MIKEAEIPGWSCVVARPRSARWFLWAVQPGVASPYVMENFDTCVDSEWCLKCSVHRAKDLPIMKVWVFHKKLHPLLTAKLGRKWGGGAGLTVFMKVRGLIKSWKLVAYKPLWQYFIINRHYKVQFEVIVIFLVENKLLD